MIELQQLSIYDIEEIEELYRNIFTKSPWNDDWSDQKQLHQYIMDLIGNLNSLALGLYVDGVLTGLALGNIRHWYSGTQYYIDEFCIKTEEQGKGLGTCFLRYVEEYIKSKGINHIFLQTDTDMPAYHFYQKNGFAELKSHVSFSKDLSNKG